MKSDIWWVYYKLFHLKLVQTNGILFWRKVMLRPDLLPEDQLMYKYYIGNK